jgi:abhydrolase domain-containing protein 12
MMALLSRLEENVDQWKSNFVDIMEFAKHLFRILVPMVAYKTLINFFRYTAISLIALLVLYATFLLALLTSSNLQSHIIYLHLIQMTWFSNLDIPETFGFLRNQVTPFAIETPDGEGLYAWHILPLELYRRHERSLIATQAGFAADVTARFAFQLLRDDPEAMLVIHCHGAAGTVGSGYRVPNYRALSAGAGTTHVLAFDYRGFGRSTGSPSESGLILDALAVVNWALSIARVPAERIILFGQSLGTAVAIAVSEHLALQSPPVVLAGTILVAPFVDCVTLASTYRVGGTIPILSPINRFSALFNYFQSSIRDTWATKTRIARYIRANEDNSKQYRLTIIHAEDDKDIPWHHTEVLFWHAVKASVRNEEMSYEDFVCLKPRLKVDLGAAGSEVEWRSEHGVIREVLKCGLHDVVMGWPVVSMAVMRVFDAADS